MLQTKTIPYFDGDVRLQGHLAFDDANPGTLPGVLIAHSWVGRSDFFMEKAQKLAELGYAGFALDMYGDAKLGVSAEQCSALMMPFIEDRVMLQRRIGCALNALRGQPEVDASRIAVIGFCFGGLCALDLARTGADLRGAVSFHGLFKQPGNTQGNAIGAKVLVLHGHDDPMVPVDDVLQLEQELSAAGADWQIHVYGNTMHAFTNPEANDPAFGTVYNAAADKRSWQSLVNFLAEVFN